MERLCFLACVMTIFYFWVTLLAFRLLLSALHQVWLPHVLFWPCSLPFLNAFQNFLPLAMSHCLPPLPFSSLANFQLKASLQKQNLHAPSTLPCKIKQLHHWLSSKHPYAWESHQSFTFESSASLTFNCHDENFSSPHLSVAFKILDGVSIGHFDTITSFAALLPHLPLWAISCSFSWCIWLFWRLRLLR